MQQPHKQFNFYFCKNSAEL